MIKTYWHLYLAILIVSIGIKAIFYSFDKAVKEMNAEQLQPENEGHSEKVDKKSKRILDFMKRPRRYTNCMRIISVFAAAFVGAVGAVQMFYVNQYIAQNQIEGWNQWIFRGGVIALIIFVLLFSQALGTAIPRKLASLNPEHYAYRFVNQVYYLRILFLPFSLIVDEIAWIGLKLFGIDLFKRYEKVSEEEIISVVNEGHEQGLLEAGEAEMIHNIIHVSEKEAADIMTHRSNIVALEGSTTLEEAIRIILNENYSRFPVYRGDFDDVIGILNVRDAFIFLEKGGNKQKPIEQIDGLLRDVSFIPETRNIMPLLQEMQQQKAHIEVVIDEYGQVAGVLTMEDILEEIVGNILDEYDEEEENITKTDEGIYEVDGMTKLKDLGEQLNVDFSYAEQETLNGLLMSKLRRIPKVDERVELNFDGYRFRVLSMNNRVIGTVHIERV